MEGLPTTLDAGGGQLCAWTGGGVELKEEDVEEVERRGG